MYIKGEEKRSESSKDYYTFHQNSFDHLSFWRYLTKWWLRLWPNRIIQRTVCHAITKTGYIKALICCQSKTLHLQKMKMPSIDGLFYTKTLAVASRAKSNEVVLHSNDYVLLVWNFTWRVQECVHIHEH